jgi:hypothetical protein
MYPKRLRSAVDLHRCTDVGNFLQGAKKCQKVQSENWASTARRAICKSNINQWIGDEACGSQRFKSLAHQWPQNRHSGMEVLFTMFRERTEDGGRAVGRRAEDGGRAVGRRAEEENQEYEYEYEYEQEQE